MNVHKHAKMMKAKVSNMDLVLFTKVDNGDWLECHSSQIPHFETDEYYLCHPNHAKECNAWLNGGNVLVDGVSISNNVDEVDWFPISLFMDPDNNVEIAPKKEKRWVLVSPTDSVAYTYYTRAEALEDADIHAEDFDDYQIFEIEVEV